MNEMFGKLFEQGRVSGIPAPSDELNLQPFFPSFPLCTPPEECAKRLSASGFQRIRETEEWKLQPRGKYYFTRNHSTIFAFVVGGKYTSGNGFNIIGAHTDSPCFKLKPMSAITSNGYVQIGVQPYGGGLWATWFDRDLSVAGRAIVRRENCIEHCLVNVPKPIVVIPNLAIHLDRTANEAFKFNLETSMRPILATTDKAGGDKGAAHHPVLLELLVAELKCSANDIADFELCLYDTNKAAIGGAKNEFIHSARIDNLMSSFCAVTALIESATDESLNNETGIRMAALFDNEEVGSESQQGAASNMMSTVIHRIAASLAGDSTLKNLDEVTLRRSFLISADMAHGVHPNYADKHEKNHQPILHKGPVIKYNANQRYATNAVTAFLIKELARRNSIPIQEFVVRNDSPCGTTIGPILAARCGMRTVDLGTPQWAMHSIRETCGTDDVDHTINLFKAFYDQFSRMDRELEVE